jgi:hypothetical protein
MSKTDLQRKEDGLAVRTLKAGGDARMLQFSWLQGA